MVAMPRCCEVTMFVEEQDLEADTQQQGSAHASLGNVCASTTVSA